MSITDPNNGAKSFITPSRGLSVYDGIAGYKNNPANFVHVVMACDDRYTLPAGKAFVVTSANIAGGAGSQGIQNEVFFYDSESGLAIEALTSNNNFAGDNTDLGTGTVVSAGNAPSMAVGIKQ